MKKRKRFAFRGLLLAGVFLGPANLMHGQAVNFPGPAVNFGNVNICAPGKTTPAPCSATLTLNYKVTAGGTLGTPSVLTLGAPNLDFTLASTTCAGSVTTGSSCSVQVTLAPKFPGLRGGAVEITDGSGNVLATTFLRGVGYGPQIAIDSAHLTTLATSPNPNFFWTGIAVDGADNVFFSNADGGQPGLVPGVFELPAGGGPVRTVGAGFASPQAVALDGAGNVYITDGGTGGVNLVVEVPRGCGSASCQIKLDGGFYRPTGIAVDFAGNVYVVDSGNLRVVELPAGCTTPSCAIPIGSGWNFPFAIAVDGAGNVFVTDISNRVVKVPAGHGAQVTVVKDLIAYGVAVDALGDLFLTDPFNRKILEAPAGGGALMTLASPTGEPVGVALDAQGNVFLTTWGSNVVASELERGRVPVHTFATTAPGTASSDSPQAFTLENSGNSLLALSGLTLGTDANFTQVAGPGTPGDCKGGIFLKPGASCDLSISFIPTVDGPLTGAAVLTDNTLNATNATQLISFSGIGGLSGTSISFPNGFPYPNGLNDSSLGFALNGGATLGDNALQLTDGGVYENRSAFFSTPIGLTSFATAFDFQLTGKEALAPDADGFTFVLQANGPDALGSPGGGLGYGLPAEAQPGAKITNSVAVKFDLHNNNGEGTSSTGIYLNGAAPTIPSVNLLPRSIDLHSGHVFHVVLTYDGSTLKLGITDQTTGATFSQPFTVDIAGFLGGPTGYAGFTASTGAETAVENILDWQLTSAGCCAAGEPNFSAGFSGTSDLTFNGDAEIAGTTLQMARDTAFEASSAFFSTAVPVSRFTSDFDFQLSRGNGDGFTFVLQSQGLNAIGTGGGGLGYGVDMPGAAGARITQSVAVKFDLHSNAGEGSNSTGVYVGGSSPTVPSTNLAPSGINLHRGYPFHVRLTYDGVHLTVNITDLARYAVFSGTYVVDIPKAVGGVTAYAGFTAGTGDLPDTVRILNWSMSSY